MPLLHDFLDPFLSVEGTFVDAFAGGGSASIFVAQKYPNHTIVMNDLDPWMSSFWSLIATGTEEEHVRLNRLLSIPPTIDLFWRLRGTEPVDKVERAYYAIFFNRTTFSGILHASPIGGKAQSSKWDIACRYNIVRIEGGIVNLRVLFKDRLRVESKDFREIVRTEAGVLYCDPPYYDQGPALYRSCFSPADHVDLCTELKRRSMWVLSYDDDPRIHELYKDFADIHKIDARYSCPGVKKTKKTMDDGTENAKDGWSNKQELILVPPLVWKI